MIEIERKFLVKSNTYRLKAFQETRISQGFLNTHPERTVRIRIMGYGAFITIKGKSSSDGLQRYEWEKEIDVTDAEDLLKLCEPGIIEKQRYLVKHGKHIFEIDEFSGENDGLVVAEVELNHLSEEIEPPAWLGEEVTGQTKYYNSQLIKNPYRNWK
ncbi:CYTH domain-containing protein [Antarcticibacterium flavum]|uniref:CYTH domain-containing protein n=1 Tax=Antarcticibacterium flavum TaxID=2058175 RepID=A0A5B7X2T1_9FLAO|nr:MULTISPECIES: CYTH domain-containing protein [Antarcticibacterium]MCM4160168.1 adenylate cyclase [Antarcticibacterium sp. W02-3]QCY69717.1 CYTH domain-containing protein [Antarcticibacterium flavum]